MFFFYYIGGLLSTAQSYPSLTTSGPTGTGSCGISTTAGAGPQCLSQALTMSLTSTSSDSEQVSLEVVYSFFFLAQVNEKEIELVKSFTKMNTEYFFETRYGSL